MSINVYQVNDLMSNMFGTTSNVNGGVFASEFPVIGDNFNNNLARYTKIVGVWASADLNADHTVGNPSWTQDVGSSLPRRAVNGYYVRSVVYTNEASFWGYIASLVGGYINLNYSHDTTGSTVDYDGKLLGHGTATGYPMPLSASTQFRDSNNLPADGTCVVTSTSSAYTRTRYMPPSYFTLYMTQGGTINSGNIRFIVDQRPSHNALLNSRSVDSGFYGDIFTATNDRKLNRRRLSIFMGRIFTGSQSNMYAYPLEEDGTNVGSVAGVMTTTYHPKALSTVTGSPTSRPNGDFRIRHHAMFPINDEYYGLVQGTKAAIMSNKTTTLPLVFFDLADTWGSSAGDITNVALTTNVVTITCPNAFTVGQKVVVGGLTTATFLNGQQLAVLTASGTQFTAAFTHADYASAVDTGTAVALGFRIAGVTVNSTKDKIYFLSEKGLLAVYDFTVTGGQLSLLASAPALGTGESYGALTLSSDGTKLYALNGCWSPDPRNTTAGSGRIGVVDYTIGSNTWGTSNDSPLNGRHNSRSLGEMITLRSGKLALLVEKVIVTGGTSVANSDPTNVNWQLMVFDPSSPAWNTNQVDATTTGGPFTYGTDYTKWTGNIGGSLLDVATGKVLIAANWKNNALWICDVSGAVAGIDNTKLTAVGVAQGSYTVFPSVAITNVVLTSNAVTFTATNSFTNGQSVTIGGLTGASFLNGQALTVTASTGTTFTANFTHANYTSTPDSGNASTVSIAKVQIRKSLSNDRTVFWHSELAPFSGGSASPNLYMAPPSFTWTSGTLGTIAYNVHDTSGNVTSFDKDKYSTTNCASANSGTGTEEYSLMGMFTGSYMGFIIHGAVFFNGEFGVNRDNLYADHNSQSFIYLPTYYKQVGGNPVLADSWADAAASGFAVPSTPGTDITIPHGLHVQFTPANGTTYATGDWHTFNVSYGSIKYQRKSRFTWAMFAGQTFQATETKPLTAVNAVKPIISDGNHTVTVTGPASITTGVDFFRTRAIWPKLVGTTPQNTPAVMEITMANSPNPSTLINVPGDGKVVTTDSASGGSPASNAFNGNPTSFWQSAIPGTHYLQIDLGSSQTVNSYGLRFNPANSAGQVPVSWTLKGSATGAFGGEEVTVDTQTQPSPIYSGHSFNVGTPGSYRYYRFVFVSTGGTVIAVGGVRLFSAVLTSSVNFAEIAFGGGWERGLKFEVDTGAGYTTITPLWRSNVGNLWCFARQVGVQKLRITVQAGQNRFSSGSTPDGNAQIGPYTLIDYGTQVQMDAARLGNAGAAEGNPARGSFDSQCIGIAADAVTISIDGDSPISRTPYNPAAAINNFYDWVVVPTLQYKVHPFWGFVLFPGAGALSSPSTQTGTSMTITYNWGRRV